MSSINIRPATDADLGALLVFEQGVIAAERPFDPTIRSGAINYYDIRYMLSAPEIRLLVAELDGVLIGSGYARIEKGRHYLKHTHHAYLGFMYVVPEHRGKGVNSLIVDALKNWAISQNINELRLDVYYDNQPAIAAYEKAGFVKHLIQMRMGLAVPAAPTEGSSRGSQPAEGSSPGSQPAEVSPAAGADPRMSLKGMSPLLLVKDLERSIGFYTGTMGFAVQFRYEEFYAGIGKDGHSIHLKQAVPLAAEREYRRKNEHVDILFPVAGIAELYNRILGSPADVIQSLREMPYGREFYVADPDGYIIAFYEE